jgi:hypothetical protein
MIVAHAVACRGPVRVTPGGMEEFIAVDIFPARDSVREVKQRIAAKDSIPVTAQQLSFDGRELLDDFPLVDSPGKGIGQRWTFLSSFVRLNPSDLQSQ